MNERVPLSFLIAQNKDEQPPVEPVVPFAAMFGDDVKIVTAVLERTAVLSEPSDRYERKSVRHAKVLVDPAVVSWRTVTSSYEGSRLNGALPGSMWRRRGNQEPVLDERERSDERARQNQVEVAATKTRELAAHRQRQPKRIEEEAMSTVTSVTATMTPAVVELKHCKRCGEDKPRAEFPSASGIYGGYCEVCTPLEKADRAAGAAGGTKRGKATGKKRRGKKIKLGETAVLSDAGPHAKVLKLLERRDALRAQLASVQAEIAEAVAG